MIINKIFYCFKEALKNIKTNMTINIIAVMTMAISFIIFLSFLVIVLNLSNFYRLWGKKIQVIIYLKDTITPEQTNTLRAKIHTFEEVDKIQFVSKQEALKSLQSSLSGQDGLIEGLQENPLPSSLEITLKSRYQNVAGVEALVKKLRNIPFVDDIEYGQKWLERFSAFFAFLKIIGFTLGGFLFLSTLLIISNTIKLTIHSRRDEIEIMKLVGASNQLIRAPFFIEAMIQGFLGSSIAIVFLFLTIKVLKSRYLPSFHFYFGATDFVFLNFRLILAMMLFGILLGLVGSLFSVTSLKELKM